MFQKLSYLVSPSAYIIGPTPFVVRKKDLFHMPDLFRYLLKIVVRVTMQWSRQM